MATHFHVRATSGDSRVVLWERSEVHPQGEVFVAGAGPVLVGMTRRVQQLLHEGLLELVEAEQPDEGGDLLEEEAMPDMEVEPAEEGAIVGNSPPAADDGALSARDEDDLEWITGISKTRRKSLNDLGIVTFGDLLAQDAAELAGKLRGVTPEMVLGWQAEAQAYPNKPT